MSPTQQDRQMPLSEFKALLGSLAEHMTGQQIVELREKEYRIANAVFDWWLRKRGHMPKLDSPDSAL